MHTKPDIDQEKNEIACSDYRFVYMGAKGLSRNQTLSCNMNIVIFIFCCPKIDSVVAHN